MRTQVEKANLARRQSGRENAVINAVVEAAGRDCNDAFSIRLLGKAQSKDCPAGGGKGATNLAILSNSLTSTRRFSAGVLAPKQLRRA